MMPVVWSDRHATPRAGRRGVGRRAHARAPRSRSAPSGSCAALGDAPRIDAEEQPDEAVHAVHDRALVEYLAGAWDAWQAAGLPNDRVVPYIFPRGEAQAARGDGGAGGLVRLRHDDADRPRHLRGRARGGRHRAHRRRRSCSSGAPAAYALTRPPGHHVTRDRVRRLLLPQQRRRRGRAAAQARAASRCSTSTPTTATARRRSSPATTPCSRAPCTSTPAHGWFPHFVGFAGRERRGPTATCRSRRAPATTGGWRRSAS